MKFISLFAGIGGFDLGFERAGMECVAQVEIDEFCQKVLAKHWPDVPRYGDIRDVGKENLPAADLVCGGFPCQPFSVAGNQRGTADDRHLWPEMLRVIAELQPTWVVGENVPGIIRIFLDQAISDLENQGYTCETFVLPAVAFDAPHRRDRVFVVAYTKYKRLQDGEGFTLEGIQRNGKDNIGEAKESSDIQPVAYASGERLEKRNGSRPRQAQSAAIERSRWTTEPSVGRVATRLSPELDEYYRGGINAHKTCIEKARTAGIPNTATVSDMWKHEEHPETSRESPGCLICGVPVSEVPHQKGTQQWYMGAWEEENEGMRGLRYGVYELYTYQSENMQPGMSIGTWSPQCVQTMENRIDRIRSLGNAVVPQVAEFIGHAIMQHERTRCRNQ